MKRLKASPDALPFPVDLPFISRMYDQHRRWLKKFSDAFRGVRRGMQGQNSFLVHVPAATAAILAALLLRLDVARFALVLLCVTCVLAAELFNSAIEWLARAITSEHDERIRDALDIASGAVLVISLGAGAAAGLVLLEHLGRLLAWW